MNWWDDDLGDVSLEKKEEWDFVLEAFEDQIDFDGWHRRSCPRCLSIEGKEDWKASLGYNTETGGYNCFKCGMHGSLPLSYREKLKGDDPIEFRTRQLTKKVASGQVEPAVGFTELYAEPIPMALEFAREYMRTTRRIPEAVTAEAHVGASLVGKLAGRIIIPIFDYASVGGPWRGWVARDATGTAERPYLYPKGMNRDGLLYNEPVLYEKTDRPCFIVEGGLDVLSLWPDAVAVMGKPIDSQFPKFMLAARPLVVCLDGDAWQLGKSLAWKLRFLGKRAGNIRLPPKTDPDEVERSWLDEEAQRVIR